MQVGKNKVVSIDYTLKDPQGDVIDTSQGRQPLAYLHGAGMLVKGLESALDGKAAGDQLNVVIQPDQGYGQRNEGLVASVPRAMFRGIDASQIQPGMQFQAQSPQGPRMVTVVKIDNENITVDGNHPLAGMALNFDVKIVDVREASPEELQHGHAHGPDGHHH